MDKDRKRKISLYSQGPTICNRIPLQIREAESVEIFKNKYKTKILKLNTRKKHAPTRFKLNMKNPKNPKDILNYIKLLAVKV